MNNETKHTPDANRPARVLKAREQVNARSALGNAVYIEGLERQRDELAGALRHAEIMVEDFYTATMTNALGRDQNRERKQAALRVIRDALAKAGK